MRVAITGATGLVGSHCTVTALVAGHDVRMVVRNPDKARSTLALHGLPTNAAEVFEADLTDHDRLRSSLAGVDGLIHAGAVFSLDPRQARAMRDVNPTSTASILGEAVRACTSLKQLSITGALLPMAELLNSTICLDLAGKGLGRDEMGIAAQLLHNNSSLQVLKLSDNPIGQFGMEARQRGSNDGPTGSVPRSALRLPRPAVRSRVRS